MRNRELLENGSSFRGTAGDMRAFAKVVILQVSIVLVLAMGTSASAGVLLENNFDGDPGNDTGAAIVDGGWNNKANANTGVMPCSPTHGWTGFASATGYDVSAADSLTVTWTVSSFTTNSTTQYVWSEGWFLGVRAGSTNVVYKFRETKDGLKPKVAFCVAGANSGATYNWSVTDLGTNNVFTAHSLSGVAPAPTVESLLDGFTATLTVKDDNTWELVTSGLSSDVSTSGALSANVTFAELASNAKPVTTYGGNGVVVVSYVQLRTYTTPAGTVIIVR